MGMLTSKANFNLTSPLARLLVGAATWTECVKRFKDHKRANRGNWSLIRVWKDRFNGIHPEDSYRRQFAENGADYDQYGADILNDIFEVIVGSEYAVFTREDYAAMSATMAAGTQRDRERFLEDMFNRFIEIFEEEFEGEEDMPSKRDGLRDVVVLEAI